MISALPLAAYCKIYITVDRAALSHLQHKLVLRTATVNHLDGILRVVKAGFPDDPEVKYRFPRRDQYPNDYLEWTCTEYKSYRAQPKKLAVPLIEAPDESDDEAVTTVALAVWDIAVLTEPIAIGTPHILDS